VLVTRDSMDMQIFTKLIGTVGDEIIGNRCPQSVGIVRSGKMMDLPGPGQVLSHCYRRAFPAPMTSPIDRSIASFCGLLAMAFLSVAGAVGGRQAGDRVSHQLDFASHFYGSAYPILRRGVMEKGSLNTQLERHSRYFFERDLLAVATSFLLTMLSRCLRRNEDSQ